MMTSVQGRIALLCLAFFLLASVSVATTSWILETEKADAQIINLAGRQRMLVEQITNHVLWLEKPAPNITTQHKLALRKTIAAFEQSLQALTNRGQTPNTLAGMADVPALRQPEIRAGLERVAQTWQILRRHLDVALNSNPDDPEFITAAQAIYQTSPRLVQQVDDVVNLYQINSTQKTALLRQTQAAFFVSALILLAVGFLAIKKSIVDPLRALGLVAERIGQGDFSTPVAVSGPRAVKVLACNLDAMRRQLKTSHAELVAWTRELEDRVARRARELSSAFEVSQKIVAELDLNQLLTSITNQAQRLTQAQTANLCILTPNGAYLDLATHNGKIARSSGLRQPVTEGLAVEVIGQNKAVAIRQACAGCCFLKPHPLEHCVAAPLRVGDTTLGALCVARTTEAPFDDDETRALTLLANSAAIAIANARLVEAEKRQTQQAATLAERERLAAEFHDHLAQTLSFLNFKADRLAELLAAGQPDEASNQLCQMKSALTDVYGQVRAALSGLREPVVDGQNLAEQLTACLAEFQERSGLTPHLSLAYPSTLALPHLIQKQAMLIVREALTNIRRHAQAQQVWVSVEYDAAQNEAGFTIEDDGRGFDPAETYGNNHLGLTIMKTRAKRSGGRLAVESRPGKGTTIIARFPLAATGADNDLALIPASIGRNGNK